MIVRPDADALMASGLAGWLTEQNDERAAAKKLVRQRQVFSVAAALVIAAILFVLERDPISPLQYGFFAGAAGFASAHRAKKPIIDKLKGGVNGAIARALQMEFAVEAVPGPEFERANRFGLLPVHGRASFEDLWSGTLGDSPFRLYEAHLERLAGSGKYRRWVTEFRGSVINIGFTRPFRGTTVIEREKDRRSFFGLGVEKDEIAFGDVTLQRCAMVDPRFEDQFTIWSSDPVEGRYLVHPEYIERLIAIEQAFAGKSVRALFCGGDLTILIESGNLFESGSLVPQDDRRLLEETIEHFGSLADLAAKLNERRREAAISAVKPVNGQFSVRVERSRDT